MLASLRPGIYSDYENSDLVWSTESGKTVGIVGAADAEVNTVYEITKISDAVSIFGETSNITTLCTLAIQNGALKVLAVPVSSESADYAAAFAVLEEEEVAVVVCDSEDATVHQLLQESVVSASESLHERIGIVSCAQDDDKYVWASDFNCERIMLIAQNPVDAGNVLSGCFITAAIAGVLCKTEDPTVVFNGTQLNGITSLSKTLSETEVDEFILAGITPLEVVIENAEIIRAVTSRVSTDGMSDITFRDINIILTQDTVISGIRKLLKSNLLGAKNNSVTRESIVTQTIIVLEDYRANGVIESYEKPEVSQSETDSTVCVVSVSFVISRGFNQIIISASINV